MGLRSGRRAAAPLLLFVAIGCAARPSATPLAGASTAGGETPRDRKARTGSDADVPAAEPVAESAPPDAAAGSDMVPAAPPTGPVSFHVLTKGQSLTRRMALELSFDMSVVGGDDPALSVQVSGHGDQEVRFKVLETEKGVANEVELFYVRDQMAMEAMGNRDEEASSTQGRRYIARLRGKSIDVRSASGKAPSADELESTQSDAREIFEMQAAMAQAAEEARADMGSPASSVPKELLRTLASDDEQVKVTNLTGVFKGFGALPSGETGALADVSFDMAFADDELELTGSLKGTATFGTGPWRPLSLKVDGPVTLHGKDADENVEMKGGGRVRMDVTYVY